MKKYTFNIFEKFAIWKHHKQKCYWCGEPLILKKTTIDHFIPEHLLNKDKERISLLIEFGERDSDFNINGFENWLPCCNDCNQEKGSKPPEIVPGNIRKLKYLIAHAAIVKRAAKRFENDTKNDKKLIGPILCALESGSLQFEDLLDILRPVGKKENVQFIPNDLILLTGGRWVHRKNIVRKGYCTCENKVCTGSNEKMFCIFVPELSKWTVQKGLYKECFDEIITCPRCSSEHKRGYIGRIDICGLPYRDQERQCD